MTYSASGGVAAPCGNCGSERQRFIDGYFDDARRAPRPLAAGDHATLVYDDPATVAPFCARFLTDGVNGGERVVALLQDDLRDAVTAHLASDVESAIEWQPAFLLDDDFDAGRAAAGYEAMITADSRPTRLLAGPDSESTAGVDVDEFSRFEAMAHATITEHGATVVCVYDASSVQPAFVDIAARCHGLEVAGDSARRNERFEYQPV